MKKNILLGFVFLAPLSLTFAQTNQLHHAEKLSLVAPKSTATSVEKAVGQPFYYDNFDSIVTGFGLGTTGVSAWTFDQSGQTGSDFGWTIDNVSDGWWAAAAAIASTSEGKFAELSNGDPTVTPTGTQALGVTYTMTTTNPINIQSLASTDQVTLSFQQYGAHFYDLQAIQISTNGTTWVTVGDNTDKSVLSQTGGAAYANPELKTINIAPFIAGNASSVYIRFMWTTEFPTQATNPNVWVTYGWYIDDLKLTTNADVDAQIDEMFIGNIVDDFAYSIIPSQQTLPLVVGVAIANNGVANFSGNVNVKVSLGATQVATHDEPITLASGVKDTFWIDVPYTATAVGTYTIDVTLPSDDVLTNNTKSGSIQTSDFVYAHDFGTTTKRGFDQDEETAMGNLYLMADDQEITSVNVKFKTGTTVGQEIEVACYELTGSIQAPMNFVTQTFYTVQSADISAAFKTIVFDDPAMLSAGSVYIVYVKKSAGTSRLYLTGSDDGDNDFSTACYGPFGTGDAINWFSGWGYSPYIRANFDPSAAIQEKSILQNVSVYPNPSNSNTNVAFNLANASTVTINVTDVTGQTVETITIDNAVAGANNANLNVANYATGIYNVLISSNEGSVTKKFIKK